MANEQSEQRDESNTPDYVAVPRLSIVEPPVSRRKLIAFGLSYDRRIWATVGGLILLVLVAAAALIAFI